MMASSDTLGLQLQTCTKCNVEKEIEAFGIRHDRGQPYRQCRDCMKQRKWAMRNPERHLESGRAWVDANKDQARAIWREMAKRKRESSPVVRIHGRISNQLWHVLRDEKNCRSAFELVGYSSQQLASHLERQFLPRMGWHNMSKWHIDHIVPLSSFDISGPDDPKLRQAWALSNLRPLWARDNLKKGARRELLV